MSLQPHTGLAAVGNQAAASVTSGESYAVVDLGAGVRTLVQEGNWYACTASCSQQLGSSVSVTARSRFLASLCVEHFELTDPKARERVPARVLGYWDIARD